MCNSVLTKPSSSCTRTATNLIWERHKAALDFSRTPSQLTPPQKHHSLVSPKTVLWLIHSLAPWKHGYGKFHYLYWPHLPILLPTIITPWPACISYYCVFCIYFLYVVQRYYWKCQKSLQISIWATVMRETQTWHCRWRMKVCSCLLLFNSWYKYSADAIVLLSYPEYIGLFFIIVMVSRMFSC